MPARTGAVYVGAVEFRCLGPLEVRRSDGMPIDLGGPQQRLVLAQLLAHTNAVLSTDQLIDGIWGDEPPESSRKILQGYVSQLRKALRDGATLESRPPGYILETGPDDVDANRFERLVEEGTAAVTSNPGRAREVLGEALALWRGRPYQDLADAEALRLEIIHLEQVHLAAREARVGAEVFDGNHSTVLPELEDLTRRYPLRERLWALRILALYRTGRQAEALRVSEEARVLLAEEVGLEPGAELRLLEQRILDQDPILDTAGAFEPEVAETRSPGRNPYKGLRPFTEADTNDFFGRRELVRRLLDALDSHRGSRLVVLAGPSGSGKSSVLHAGLIPALRDSGRDVATMYPGSMSPRTLADAVHHLDSGSSSVLIVDQLEEIFSQATAEAQSDFLDALAETATAEEGPHVLVAVRADFLDHVLSHSGVAPLVAPGLVLVTPLQDHEVREIVVEPARRSGATVAPDVVASAVSHVARRPAALPLVEYALTDLFDRSGGTKLTQADLEAAGGISGALVKRAEEVYAGLDDIGRATIRTLLLRLVTVTEDGTLVKRRIPTDALDGLPGAEELASLLGDYRLLTFDRGPRGVATVEVAHEALLREWPRLSVWVDEARDALHRHRQLAEAAAEWAAHERSAEYLLSGPVLSRLADWSDADLMLSEDERAFLAASLEAEAEIMGRRQRRRRLVLTGFGAAAVVALGLAVAALAARNDAESQAALARSESAQAAAAAERAQTEAQRAFANELNAAAQSAIDEDPELGLLLSLQAIANNPDPEVLLGHRVTLRRAMDADILVARHTVAPPGELLGLHLAPDGSRLAFWAHGRLQQVDPMTWQTVWTYEDEDLMPDPGTPWYSGTPVFSPDGGSVAIGTRGTPPRLLVLNAATGTPVEEIEFAGACRVHTGPQAWSGDGLQLGVSLQADCDQPFSTSSLRILDTTTWQQVTEIPVFGQAVFAEGAPRLAAIDYPSGEPGRKAIVYDTGTFEVVGEFGASIGTLHPDGRSFAAADPDGQSVLGPTVIDIYDLDTGLRTDRVTGLDHRPFVYATGFVEFPEGYAIVVGTGGQTTGVWDATSGRLIASLPTGVVWSFGYDTAVQHLYTASPDGTISIWDFSPGGQASPESLSSPYWFEANWFSVNPQSRIGVAMHWGTPQNPIESFAVFDAITGSLESTLVEEIGNHSINALPNGRVLLLRADSAAGTTGPFVVWDAASRETTELIGCVTASDAWDTDPGSRSHQVLSDDAPCLDGGTPFITTAAPVLSADGTEVMAADLSGRALVWDAFTLDEKDALDLGGIAGGPVWIEAVGADWMLVRRIGGEEFLVIDRSTLDIIARFGFALELNAEIARDGSFLIMRHLDTSIHRVDTDSWELRLIHVPGQFVRGLALSPAGDRLMLGGTDGFVHIIDAATGALLDQIPFNHVSDGHWIDEHHIAVGTGQTGMWSVITLDIDEVLVHAADQLTRGFTDEECRIYRIEPCPSLDDLRAAVSRRAG